jgi:hypothetical protein
MKLLDKLLSIFKPWSNLNVSTESLKVTITSERVKLDPESLMTNDRVKRQMQKMPKF